MQCVASYFIYLSGGITMKKFLKQALAASALLFGVASLLPVYQVQAAEDKELLIYSNSLSNGRQEWLEEKAAEAGFKLSFVSGGSGEIYNRLLAEAENPQADVVFGMDEINWKTVTEADLIHPYEPKWAGEIDEAAITGDGFYFPTVEERITMYYNPEFVEADQLPSTMEGFGQDESYQGKYRVPNSFGGGTDQKIALSILLQHQDEAGELGISDEGWQALADFLANGFMPVEGDDHLQMTKEGEIPYTYYWSSGVAGMEEEYQMTVEPINFEPGVITMREQVGIVNKGDDNNYQAAEEFVDWFGSADVQGAWAKEHGSLPVNPKAQEQAGDKIKSIAEATTVMEVDWEFVRENLDSWIEKIELDLMP